MTINYPNGNDYSPNNKQSKKKSTINYGDRGMSLEQEINLSNAYYLNKGIAVIHKKPTPIQIVKVDYPKRSAAVIKEAYFKQASTTDYNGIFKEKYIDFDAKETTNKTSFPLNNFHQHQISHMQQCSKLGGICFSLIKFVKTNELFVLNGTDLFFYWERQYNDGRKSISKQELENSGYKLSYQINPLIPYLDAVDKILTTMEENKMSSDETYSRMRKNQRHHGPVFHIIMWIILFVFLLILMGCGMFAYYAATAPKISYHTLSSDNSTTIYDKNGKVISRLGMQNRDYVKQQDIPDNLKNAIISIEDRHFYSDKGVDPIRIIEAAGSDLIGSGGGLQGGSTLTQQLVKLSVFSTKSSDQTLKRKAQEAWLAIKVDRDYSKQQIMEFYVNKVYMGNNSYGMQTASQLLFHKPLNKLDLSQTALLAGLPQAPVAYNPVHNPKYAQMRRDTVLEAMVRNKSISRAQADQAEKESVKKGLHTKNVDKTPTQKDEKYADGYISQVIQELKNKGYNLTSGNKVYTNLDMSTQKHMYKLANDKNSGMDFPNKNFQIGATMVDPHNGKVVSMLGSRKQNVLFGLNRAVQTDRSSGSTMKPLMDYGPAIEYLKYPTYQPIKDTPFTYPGTGKELNDFDNKHEGTITMRQALIESRNIPAIRTLQAVGIPQATNFLNGLGMKFKQPLDLQNGIGAYISTEQEAAAYAAFANGGIYHKPYMINKVVTPTGEAKHYGSTSHRAMSTATAFMMTDMLKGVMTDPKGSGTAAKIDDLYEAGKTGTVQYPGNYLGKFPKDASMDSWFTGYTKNLSLSVWTGYDRPLEDGHYVSQSQTKIAQKFYKETMEKASENLPNENWDKPSDVVKTHKDHATQYYIVGYPGDSDAKVSHNSTQSEQASNDKSVVNNNSNSSQNKNESKTDDDATSGGTSAANEETPNDDNKNNSTNNNQDNNNQTDNSQNDGNQTNNTQNKNPQGTQSQPTNVDNENNNGGNSNP